VSLADSLRTSNDSSASYFKLPIDRFLEPKYKGKDYLSGPSYAFLIQHGSGKRILFDLGIRKDWENYSPVLVNNFKSRGWELGAEHNTADILQDNGLDVSGGAIDAVVWSHRESVPFGHSRTFADRCVPKTTGTMWEI